jgi:hypothetical protein
MMASFSIEFLVFYLTFCPISPIKGKKSCLTVAFIPLVPAGSLPT